MKYKIFGSSCKLEPAEEGREQFISNKRAIGRKKDLADIEAIGEA